MVLHLIFIHELKYAVLVKLEIIVLYKVTPSCRKLKCFLENSVGTGCTHITNQNEIDYYPRAGGMVNITRLRRLHGRQNACEDQNENTCLINPQLEYSDSGSLNSIFVR